MGRPLPWERRAIQSRHAYPEEAREPSGGTGRRHFDHAVPPSGASCGLATKPCGWSCETAARSRVGAGHVRAEAAGHAEARALRQDFLSSCSRPLAMPISDTSACGLPRQWLSVRRQTLPLHALSSRARSKERSEEEQVTRRFMTDVSSPAERADIDRRHRRMRWSTPPGTRREILALNVLASLTSLTPPQPALARTTPLVGDSADQPPAVVMPLYRCNGAFCTYYTVDDQRFRAVVDTGSPFLMVDGRCGPAPTPYCFTAPVRQAELEPRTSRPQAGLLRRRVSLALDRCAASTWRT